MIDVIYSSNGKAYVMASALRIQLEIGTPLNTWFPRMIAYGFEEKQDYLRLHNSVESANGMKKAVFDWYVTVEMAKHIAMMQRTPKGKEIREYLLNIEQRVSDGEFLNQAQFMALFDICKVMGFFSVQKFFKDEHFKELFTDRKHEWWDNRARLFGYTTDELKSALLEIGKKYKNTEQAMLHVDKYNLIRMGVIDLFMTLGKSKTYAQNVGNIAKTIAEELKPEIYNDIDTLIDFKTDKQRVVITDLKNKTDSKILQQFLRGNQSPKVAEDYNQKKLFDTSGNTILDQGLSKALNNPPKKE